MRFKEFLKICEDLNTSEKGLLGIPLASSLRKPSDGQPFKDKLGVAAGQTPRGASGGAAANPMGKPATFMKKK